MGFAKLGGPGIVGGGIDPEFTTLSDGQVPKADATGRLVYSGATVDTTTLEWTYDKTINIPAGSIDFGLLELSEGVADLVVGDLFKNSMSFSVNAPFDETTGSANPNFKDFGASFVLNVNLDDTQVLTTNPLTFQIASTVVAPDTRLLDELTIRTNGAMTNLSLRISDNATGAVLRYIPDKSSFDTGIGLSVGTGDVTFFLTQKGTDTTTTFFLGFTPFELEDSQLLDVEVRADSIDLLGNISGVPYLVAEAHDGPIIDLAPLAAPFVATCIPFVDADLRLDCDDTNLNWDSGTSTLNVENLTVNGTLTTVDVETLSVAAAFVDTNAGYTTTTPKEGGLLTVYLPTATTATVTAGAFVAGIAATSNPTVTTVEASTLAADDIIQISSSTANDGIFEVLTHAANVLTIRGIGTTPTDSTFALNQFTADASDNATITKVTVGVMQFSTTGDLQTGKGAEVANVTYENLVRNRDAVVELQIPAAAGNADINFNDEVEALLAQIRYNDTSGELEITTVTGAIALDSSAGGQSIILNNNTAITADGESIIIIPTLNSSAIISLDTSSATTGLVMEYSDLLGESSILSIGDLNITAPGNTVNINGDPAVTATDPLVNRAFVLGEGGARVQTAEGGNSLIASNSGFNQIEITPEVAGTATYMLFEDNGVERVKLQWDNSLARGNLTSVNRFTMETTGGLLHLLASGLNDNVIIESNTGVIDIISSSVSGTDQIHLNSNMRVSTTGETLSTVAGDLRLVSDAAAVTIIGDTDVNITSTTDDIFLTSGDDIILSPTGNVGIREGTPAADLHITNGAASIRLEGTNAFTDFRESTELDISHTRTSAGAAIFDFLSIPSDGTSGGTFRFNAGTTTGDLAVTFLEPSGGGTSARIGSGTSNSFINANGGFYGVGHGSPIAPLHVFESTAGVSDTTGIKIEQAGAGDALLHFDRTAVQDWTMGINASSGNNFCLDVGTALSAIPFFTMATNGHMGLSQATPASTLHVRDSNTATGATAGVTIEQDSTGDALLHLNLTGVQDWTMGIDNSDSDKFKIHNDVSLADESIFTLDTAGFVGLNKSTPVTPLHIYENSSATILNGITLEQDGTGDSSMHFDLTLSTGWTIGLDNSIGNQFAIQPAEGLTAAATVQISTANEIGINKTPRANHCLDIDSTVNTVVALYDSKDVTIEQGTQGQGSSTDFYFNRNDVGFNQDEFVLFNDNNNIPTRRAFFMQYTSIPGPGLSVREGNWVAVGVGNNEVSNSIFHVRSDEANAGPIITMESTGNNGSLVEFTVGDSEPNTAVTSQGGSVYHRANGALSATYESLEATVGEEWFKRRLLPPTSVEINNAAQFEALATAGTITVTTSAELHIFLNVDIVTATVFVIEDGASFSFTSLAGARLTSISTGTLFTIGNTSAQFHQAQFLAGAGATFLDYEASFGSSLVFNEGLIFGFGMGEVRRVSTANGGPVISFRSTFIIDWGTLDLIDSDLLMSAASVLRLTTGTSSGPFADFLQHNGTLPILKISSLAGGLLAGESIVRIDAGLTGIAGPPSILISDSTIFFADGAATMFDTTGIAPTAFTVVDNSTTTPTAIATVSDNGGVAVFNTLFAPELGQIATLSGFATETTYNVTGVVTVSGPSSFEIDHIAFAGTDSGSVQADGITITSTAHGLSAGTGVTISTDDATDYDGHYAIYNVTTDTFDVSTEFDPSGDDPQDGTWSTEGLDQSDPNVLAFGNPNATKSNYIATAFVNENTTAVAGGAIGNGTFRDMVFGTAGSALVVGSTMERWKLIDELNGTFEYTGEEPFSGRITFDIGSISSGGTVLFRFKWQHDIGAGFVDLPDNVIIKQSIGSDIVNASRTFPLQAVKGDQIKPQFTRNSGSSGYTADSSAMYVTQ